MMRSYLPAIILSIIFHAILVFLVVWGWQFADVKPVVKPPSYIKATLVELKAKTNKKPKVDPVKKQNERVEQLKKQEQVKKQQQEQKAKKEAESQARKKAQELRKNQLAKKKIEKEKAEKIKQDALRKVQAQKRQQQEKQRKAEALKKQALADELAKEKERLQAKEDEATAQSYSDLIAARVRQNWSRPPSARNGMQVELRIQLVPTGQVVSVSVIKSSGNDAFDRSAIRAIKKIERFSEIRDMPSGVFERNFRTFIFSFNPQDLRQ